MMLTETDKRQIGIYYLRYYPDPILNHETKWVLDFNKIQPMATMMKKFLGRDAIGLAAPQVGIQQRFFVWKIDEHEPNVAINPRIEAWSPDSHVSEEGCLSFPGYKFKVLRANTVDVAFQNEMAENVTMQLKGLHAELFQHEIDHLDGITIINNMNLIRMDNA